MVASVAMRTTNSSTVVLWAICAQIVFALRCVCRLSAWAYSIQLYRKCASTIGVPEKAAC